MAINVEHGALRIPANNSFDAFLSTSASNPWTGTPELITSGVVNGLTSIIFDVSTFSDDGGYTTATTGGLTVVKSGLYKVQWELQTSSAVQSNIHFDVNGSNIIEQITTNAATVTDNIQDVNSIMVFNEGNTITMSAATDIDTNVSGIGLALYPLVTT